MRVRTQADDAIIVGSSSSLASRYAKWSVMGLTHSHRGRSPYAPRTNSAPCKDYENTDSVGFGSPLPVDQNSHGHLWSALTLF